MDAQVIFREEALTLLKWGERYGKQWYHNSHSLSDSSSEDHFHYVKWIAHRAYFKNILSVLNMLKLLL